MHSNKYKHAWYFENFAKQNGFVWMVKPLAACNVLTLRIRSLVFTMHKSVDFRKILKFESLNFTNDSTNTRRGGTYFNVISLCDSNRNCVFFRNFVSVI